MKRKFSKKLLKLARKKEAKVEKKIRAKRKLIKNGKVSSRKVEKTSAINKLKQFKLHKFPGLDSNRGNSSRDDTWDLKNMSSKRLFPSLSSRFDKKSFQ